MKRAIVTGATGFIGRALTKTLLECGTEVWAVVRDGRKLDDIKSESLHIVEADFAQYPHLAERIDVRGFDVCFYLAWNGTWGMPFRDYALQLQNAEAACDMVEQAAKLGCERFILVSWGRSDTCSRMRERRVCHASMEPLKARLRYCAASRRDGLESAGTRRYCPVCMAPEIAPG